MFFLPRKGSERNSEIFCSAEQPEFRRKEPFVPCIPSSAELFSCLKFPTLHVSGSYIYNIIYNVMLYLSNHSYLWTIANSVLLVAKGREVGRQHDLLFLFLLFVRRSGGGAAPRVAPRSGPCGGGGCTMRVPSRSRPLKKKVFCCHFCSIAYQGCSYTGSRIRIFLSQIPDPGSKRSRIQIRLKELKYF